MRVEVYGGTLSSFGDELMLRRILAELSPRLDNFLPVVQPRDVRYGLRAELGLRHILPGYGRGPLGARMAVGLLDRFAPERAHRLTDLYGLVSPRSVDGMVTLSGFAFSDVWGSPAARAAKVFRSYARRGKPVILLPQALGPFETPEVRDAFRTIVRSSVLVFARDNQSLEYARSVCDGDGRIRRAYDIVLAESLDPTAPREDGLRVSLVPNQRMLDRGPTSWRSRYMDVMSATARSLIEAGAEVDVVVHGRESGDESLAAELVKRVNHARSVRLNDPGEVRLHLAQSSAVVASRYHALVGALAHGVPVLGIGWAHKYQGLFEDFGIPEFCVAENESQGEIIEKALSICTPDKNRQLRQSIRSVLPKISQSSDQMWDEVAQALTHGQ